MEIPVNFSLEVDKNLPHKDQILAFGKTYEELIDISNSLKKEKEKAMQAGDAVLNLKIDKETERIQILATPFFAAQAKAKNLKDRGYLLKTVEGDFEPVDSPVIQAPDPLISLFMILFDAVVDGLKDTFLKTLEEEGKKGLFEIRNAEDVFRITSGLFILQIFRDIIISPDDNGEIAKFIRDPIKRPIEIIGNTLEGARKSWENDNGDVGNAIKKAFGL